MNNYKKILCIVFIFVLLSLFGISALAETADSSDTADSSETSDSSDTADSYEYPKHLDEWLQNCEFTVLSGEPTRRAISAFAVNEEGKYVVAYKTHETTVAVYSAEGEFEYGYRFVTTGVIYLIFEGDIVTFYLNRPERTVSFDPDGNIVDYTEIYLMDKSIEYTNPIVAANKETVVGNNKYFLRNKSKILNFMGEYSELVTVDENGNERTLYKSTKAHPHAVRLIVFASVASVAIPFTITRIRYMQEMSI